MGADKGGAWMADFAEPRLDVAMLPVWGWGPKLSEGHLHPASAAKALQYLRPTAAVPIHSDHIFHGDINRFVKFDVRGLFNGIEGGPEFIDLGSVNL